MANTSATGGYLEPAPTQPLDDDALLDFMQLIIRGITGLPGPMVRPAFQPDPAKRPGIAVDWCAFYISNNMPEAGHIYEKQDANGLGSTTIRHETFDMRCSFYGPNSGKLAGRWRDGLEMAQNREPMSLNGMAYVSSSQMVKLGDLVDEQWYRRVDITTVFRRELNRRYEVLSFLQAQGQIITETMTIDWAVGPEV